MAPPGDQTVFSHSCPIRTNVMSDPGWRQTLSAALYQPRQRHSIIGEVVGGRGCQPAPDLIGLVRRGNLARLTGRPFGSRRAGSLLPAKADLLRHIRASGRI